MKMLTFTLTVLSDDESDVSGVQSEVKQALRTSGYHDYDIQLVSTREATEEEVDAGDDG